MKEIYLPKDYIMLVDDKYYNHLIKFCWHPLECNNGLVYAIHRTTIDKKWIHYLLHHEVIKLSGKIIPYGYLVDHIDRNTFNNLELNLRVISRSISAHNRGLFVNNTSGFKGVSFHEKTKKWQARIQINGYRQTKSYDTFEEAIVARLKLEQYYSKQMGNNHEKA